MDQIGSPPATVRGGGLPTVLAWAFDAFEAIRSAARDCEDQAPELFATFMMAAGAAVEARNILADAPSLPSGSVSERGPRIDGAAGVEQIADELAALAESVAERLSEAGAGATLPADRSACTGAAESARGICGLLSASQR